MAYWYLDRSNYWGHNAIIRTGAFMTSAGLPKLAGVPPLGGEIMSHDFVEAALLRRAGWSVWLVPELGGSYEELPPTISDYAKRDRRWCLGNLQHVRLLAAKGLCPISRVHMADGAFSYLASPMWLLLLLLTTFEALRAVYSGGSFGSQPVAGVAVRRARRTARSVLRRHGHAAAAEAAGAGAGARHARRGATRRAAPAP